jgi:hypothetical protein
VGDVVAIALESNLQQLRHLELTCCGLSSMQCLQAVGQLRHLTELRLLCFNGLSEEGLMCLTGLSNLQQLRVPSIRECGDLTDEVLSHFWWMTRQQLAGFEKSYSCRQVFGKGYGV